MRVRVRWNWTAFRSNFRWRRLRADVMGGITVALVALPLALAFGIASGAGPAAGLYAAIFAGFVTSLFGGSEIQVSGPTGAMTVVLVDIVSRHGVEGMFLAGVIAGVMQIVAGLLGLGNLVKYLPYAVISGFTNGIAVLIFLSQVEALWRDPAVAFVTALFMLLAIRYARRTIPASLYGLAAGVAFNHFVVQSAHLVGEIPRALPAVALPLAQLPNIGDLILPAVTIFLLGSIEALLSAEIGDLMTGQKHNSNRELIGQGLGNIVSAVVGGVPVTGAIARTAVNAKSGARTRLSGMIHSLVLLLIVLVFGHWASMIPLAALAAILAITAVRMADLEGLRYLPRARWTYGVTLIATMALTVIQDLTIAVVAGLALAALFAIVDLAGPQVHFRSADTVIPELLPRAQAECIQIVSVGGPLFFLGVAKLMRQVQQVARSRTIVLDLAGVSSIDDSGALMLRRIAEDCRRANQPLYLANVGKDSLRTLLRLGVIEALGRRRVCRGLRTALLRAAKESHRASAVEAVSGHLSPAEGERTGGFNNAAASPSA